MAKKKEAPAIQQAANPVPDQEPVINEVDGAPIFHAPEEEGNGDA